MQLDTVTEIHVVNYFPFSCISNIDFYFRCGLIDILPFWLELIMKSEPFPKTVLLEIDFNPYLLVLHHLYCISTHMPMEVMEHVRTFLDDHMLLAFLCQVIICFCYCLLQTGFFNVWGIWIMFSRQHDLANRVQF